MNKFVVVVGGLAVSTVALALEFRHPKLKDAYEATSTAIRHIQAAQAANKGVEFGGHAQKAIELIQSAQRELEQAEIYRDSHR